MNRRQALKQLTAVGAALLRPASFLAEPLALQPGIRLNQLGYLSSAQKIASVINLPASAGSDFRVLRGENVVFSGELSPARDDAASGDAVAQADFSGLTQPGVYTVQVGELSSDPFTIATDVYRPALFLTARAFYGQRCGCRVDLGGGYEHPACHLVGAYHPTSGRAGKAKHRGGWHDAGDYGRYVVNSGISTATLLYAYELYAKTLRGLKLDIPRHRRHLPDILAEARWNLDWMMALQDEDGGVWHKQTSEHFCGVLMPQADALTSYVIGSGHAPYKTTAATADLAATAAIAARVYARYDRRYARRCLRVARRAWRWAVKHPDEPYTNPPSIFTGGYDDRHLSDELAWASAELFRTTFGAKYDEQFRASFTAERAGLRLEAPSWGNVWACAGFAYAQTAAAVPEVRDTIVEVMGRTARNLVQTSAGNGYGNTLSLRDYNWGSNGTAGNQSMLILLADQLEPIVGAREAALNNLHYLLGRNCHGVSWVTQLGARPFLHPHHRPSQADGIAAPWPGLLSGGPNRYPGDEAARTLAPGPPMRMWIDDERAYSMNEIAINWNAPLVFLLAAANTPAA